MLIEETEECYELMVIADSEFNLHQQTGDWIQIDKQQARQLIEVLQKWIDGGEVE